MALGEARDRMYPCLIQAFALALAIKRVLRRNKQFSHNHNREVEKNVREMSAWKSFLNISERELNSAMRGLA